MDVFLETKPYFWVILRNPYQHSLKHLQKYGEQTFDLPSHISMLYNSTYSLFYIYGGILILHDDSFGRLISNTSHVLGFEVEYESIMPRGNGNINKETDCGNTIEQYIIYR